MTSADLEIPAPYPAPRTDQPLWAADVRSGQEARWCPGCGDHAALTTFLDVLPTLPVPTENTVVVSGIGCSSRVPYAADTRGARSVHGLPPAFATGVALNRPDLSVWVVITEGGALSIGGNHLIHALRRNVTVKIVLVTNRGGGPVRSQDAPTLRRGKSTWLAPDGSPGSPLDALSLALGAGATFVARATDVDREHLGATLAAAAVHTGAALVEICRSGPARNGDSYGLSQEQGPRQERVIRLEDGKPITFGARADQAVVRDPVTGDLAVGPSDDPRAVTHRAATENPAYAFALAQLASSDLRHPLIGVFRSVRRPSHDALFQARTAGAQAAGPGDLRQLLLGPDPWTVG